MLKALIMFISFGFILNTAAGQEQEYQVSGDIYDEQNQPLPYASVVLKTAGNDKLIKGGISDDKGHFELLKIPKGAYVLQISSIGFKTSFINLNLKNTTLLQKIILQSDASLLGEVTVSARKRMITRKTDRLVMNIENNAAFAGKSSLALFSMAPGVFVTNGSISINGVWGTRVMVNGRLLSLKGADLKNYLLNLKAEQIQSVEIIAHPPAEYEAEGSGGMINIIMKKNVNTGLNGYLGHDYSIGLGKYPSYRPYAGLNYKKDKLAMSFGYSYLWDKSFQEVSQDRAFPDEGQYAAENHSISKRKSNSLSFTTTYDISDKQYLGIDYTGQYGTFTDSLNSISNIVYPETQNNIRSVGSFPSYAKTNYSNFGLNYSITTDTLGSKLTLLADYTYNDKNASSGSKSSDYGPNGNLLRDTLFTFKYPSVSKIFTADIKYNQKFHSGYEFTAGSKLASTDINNANAYDIFSGSALQANANAFDYQYRERIYAGFVTLAGKILKTDFNIGLRGEDSHIKGQVIGDGQDMLNKRDYFNLFPSVFLQKSFSKEGDHTLNFSYNRRISRPSYLELNPYKYYIDNYSVQTGNPQLNPQFTNSYELGYLFKKQYNLSFSYSHSKDVINQVIENDPSSTLMTILRKNTGQSKVYTVTIAVPVSFTKWWSSTNNLLLTHSSSVAPEFDLSANSLILQTQQEFTLDNSLSMSVNAFYTPRILQGNIITGRIATVDAGLQKKWLKNKLVTRASISDIFYTNNFRATSYYNNSVIHIRQKEQTRLVSLSLLYNFNMGQAFKLKNINKSNTEEKKRL